MLLLGLAAGCARSDSAASISPATTPAPMAAVEANDDHTWTEADELAAGADEPSSEIPGFVISSPERAKTTAEDAVSDHLDPDQTWQTSPVLPARWPSPGVEVLVLFFPLVDQADSVSEYQLYSAAYAVSVSLVDGSTQISELTSRRLGKISRQHESRMQRNELARAERALIRMMLADNIEGVESSFWGYRKYLHEHPKFARDIKAKQPKFVAWLHARG